MSQTSPLIALAGTGIWRWHASSKAEEALDIGADPRLQAAVEYLTPIFKLMGVEDFTFSALKKGEATMASVAAVPHAILRPFILPPFCFCPLVLLVLCSSRCSRSKAVPRQGLLAPVIHCSC